jgi:hypothetical protein
MVMRVMLIGLLVTGAVAMLETDVSADCVPCLGFPCCFSFMKLNEVGEDVTKDENIQVWLIGNTAHRRAEVREMLIKRGLRPENIGELNIEDRELLRSMRERRSMREGQMVIVTQPK